MKLTDGGNRRKSPSFEQPRDKQEDPAMQTGTGRAQHVVWGECEVWRSLHRGLALYVIVIAEFPKSHRELASAT